MEAEKTGNSRLEEKSRWLELQKKLAEMASEFRKKDNWALVGNYDADGISSLAILAKTMERLGMHYKTLMLRQLYRESIAEIEELGKNYFFCDFGSGQLDFLKEALGENFFVLDHHQPLPVEHALHANPLLFGFDGGNEISASGMAFLFALAVNEKNADLASLAIVGAVGDMQDETGKLVGLNQWIAEKGIEKKVLQKKIDLRLYGRISRPLVQFLMFASNPVLPELTANEENCVRFLQGLGIDLKQGEEWVSYEMLSAEQKMALSSALIVHLHEWNLPEWKIKGMIGEVYSLSKENPRTPLHDAKEYGTLLNACGRHNWSEIGLAVCMGDRSEAYARALSLLAQHRKQLRDGIQFLKEKGVKEKKSFYFVDAEKNIPDSIVGIVAGMLYGSGTIGFQKPIVAFARYPDESIKASGRATQELVKRGLNLGKAFREICTELGEGNEGGGHCLHPETLVQLNDGTIKEIGEIQSFNQLLSKSNEFLTYALCAEVFANEKTVMKIKTPVYEIKCSSDHRFFKFENLRVVEKKAAELKSGDFILAVKKIEFSGRPVKLEHNPFCYLDDKGLEKIKETRIQKKLAYAQIVSKNPSFSHRYEIYDKETLHSHRFSKNQLNELLGTLDVPKEGFYNKHVIRQLTVTKEYLDDELAWLIGYIQGDGFIGAKRIECKEPDEKIIQNYMKAMVSIFNNQTVIVDCLTYKKMRNYSADLCRFFKRNFPETLLFSHELKVPEKIMHAETPILSRFIQGVFDADGGVYDRFIYFDSISKRFVKTIQILLLRFGILSRIVCVKQNPRFRYRLEITDFEAIQKFGEKIGFTKNCKKDIRLQCTLTKMAAKNRNSNLYSPLTYQQVTQFIDAQGIPRKIFNRTVLFSRTRNKKLTYKTLSKYLIVPLKRYLPDANDSQRKNITNLLELFDSNFAFFEVRKINSVNGRVPMVDLSIPTTQNFFADGLIVHNSIAAGVKLQTKNKELFLELLESKLEEQLQNKKTE